MQRVFLIPFTIQGRSASGFCRLVRRVCGSGHDEHHPSVARCQFFDETSISAQQGLPSLGHFTSKLHLNFYVHYP